MKHPPMRSRDANAGELMSSLLAAAHSLEARAEQSLGAVGLSMAKLSVLTALVKAGEPLALSELAERLSCVRSNITQLVDRLEAEGLVQRVADRVDRRSVRAVITREGIERERIGAREMGAVQASLAASLSSADRKALSRALDALG